MHEIHKDLSKQYRLQPHQLNTRSFHQPLAQRTKDTSLWNYLKQYTGARTTMINKIIKFDLKYFKDANVDTLIPLRYEYFSYQRTISQFFNQKKQKFHKRSVIQELSHALFPTIEDTITTINIYTT